MIVLERKNGDRQGAILVASIIGRAIERSKRLRGAHVLLRIGLCRVGVAGVRVRCRLLAGDIEPSGLLFGEFDNREPSFALDGRVLEKQIDLLETAGTSFRVQEVDRRDDGEVDDGVGGVCLVHDVGEHDWACDDDAEVGEPVDGS